MFKEKRGQSALEYLMTYGWALIVIVIVIAALVFLINPTQIGTENCTGFQKQPIGAFKLGATGLEMKVTNMTGRAISAVDFNATFDDGEVVTAIINDDATVETVNANAEASLVFTRTGLDLTGNQSIDLTVSYNDGDYTRDATATCKGTI